MLNVTPRSLRYIGIKMNNNNNKVRSRVTKSQLSDKYTCFKIILILKISPDLVTWFYQSENDEICLKVQCPY